MALVVLPEGQQRSGKQGGMVWSHNRGGAYVRARGIPTNPQSTRQVAVRANMQVLVEAWIATLTNTQRDQWNTYAANVPWSGRLGQSVNLTGQNMYISGNMIVLDAGGTRVDDGPIVLAQPGPEGSLAGAGSEGTQLISVTFNDTGPAWVSQDDAYQVLYCSRPQNGQTTFPRTGFQLLGAIDGDSVTPPTTPQTFSCPFAMQQGQRLWIRSRIVLADGRVSPLTQASFLCAA